MIRFGTDGVRGRAGVEVTAALARALGNAAARVLGPRLAIARDTRPSGPELEEAAVAGVREAGGTAVRLGVLPTPAISALVPAYGLDGGLMITASHNPAHDNGVKALGRDGRKLDAATLAALSAAVEAPARGGGGGEESRGDAADDYVAVVLAALPPGRWLAGRTVVLDTACGAAADVAPRVLDALGARVELVSGAAINADCGAVHPARMAARAAALGVPGLALDGDGDRVVLARPDGALVDGDGLLWLLRRPPVVVGTVMSNGGLEAALRRDGVGFVRAKVGDANVAAAMAEHGAAVGGEPSGHLLLADGLPTADGLLAGLRALHAGLDGLDGYAPHAQAHAAVPRVPLDGIEALVRALEADGARVVVRPSGTEPVVRVMVEHADAAAARAGADRLVAFLGRSP